MLNLVLTTLCSYGVTMGSPLGSVLTNIFVGFHEDWLFKNVQEPIVVVVGEC